MRARLSMILRFLESRPAVGQHSPAEQAVLRAGKAKYDAKKHALVWKIKRFPGAQEQSLVGTVELIATTKEKKSWSRPPISLSFQVRRPQHACCEP